MRRWRRNPAWLALAMILWPLVSNQAAAQTRHELESPTDPLRSSVGLSAGLHYLDNENYQSFFDEERLQTWSLRYDYRVWQFIRLGAAVSASNKSRLSKDISFGSEAYPIRYSFSAFQGLGEIYLRSHLPSMFRLSPYASIGLVASRIHAESEGYTGGYDAIWEEYRPASDIIQYSGGWRAALGFQFHVWANFFLTLEGSRIKLGDYDGSEKRDPPVGLWDHSGYRLETGLMQRF